MTLTFDDVFAKNQQQNRIWQPESVKLKLLTGYFYKSVVFDNFP